jgi:hypothetical protein
MTKLCGSDNPSWKGGKIITESNGLMVRNRIHPRSRNGYVPEHILIAERILGKPLSPKHPIHHPFGKTNNDVFVICENQGYHNLLEQRTRSFKACGHASWRKCVACKQYDEPENLKIPLKNWPVFHHDCYTKYRRERG